MSDEYAGKGADVAKIGHSPAQGSPWLGPAKALVVVNIFSDFQCPVCVRSADPIKQLVLDFPDRVKVVFRNNALYSHSRALPAALAAHAAGKQGKFWQYHDLLFHNRRGLDDATLKQYAVDLGLDVARWERDIADPDNVARIHEETSWAEELGVPGTPGIFVNGNRQMGWGSYRSLHQTVERELAKGEELLAAGKTPAEIPALRIREEADKNSRRPDEPAPDLQFWVNVLTGD